MDSADFISLMLTDKSYYDYDFEVVKKPIRQKTYEESVMSEEELHAKLARFGWGKTEENKG